MKSAKTKSLVTLIAMVAAVVMALVVAMLGVVTKGTFWALVPPIVAIGLALITKEVYSSLFTGVLVGAILAGGNALAGSGGEGFSGMLSRLGRSLPKSLDYAVNDGLIEAIKGTAGIFLFLVLLGAIVALVNRAGGSAAFGRWAKVHIKSRVGAQLATFALGVLIFIDDYFNCLTVGSVMTPVTDSHRVSRAKLSYLIDATAAPICMIAPISSWAAAFAGNVTDEVSEQMSPIALFIKAIPFNFYSLFSLMFIIAIVLMKADYGPMRRHELNAINNGDLFSNDTRVEEEKIHHNEKGRVSDLIVPIAVLIIAAILGLLYVGGFFSGELKGDLIGSFGNTDATVGLPWGTIIAFVIIVIYLLARKLITFQGAMDCIPQGFKAMVPAITILTLATSLKNITNGALGSQDFVRKLMESDVAQNLANFLPAVIFLIACLIAFATGTSWGTFGILVPIVCTMFSVNDPLFFISISACLAGAVCGDHCSPISDTTIMSSAGAGCVHVDHVSTQLPYALTVAGISFVMYLFAGLIQSFAGFTLTVVLSLALGAVAIVAILLVIKSLNAKKAA